MVNRKSFCKPVKICSLAFGTLLFSALTLKSTSFQKYLKNDRIVIAMKPIHSDGDNAFRGRIKTRNIQKRTSTNNRQYVKNNTLRTYKDKIYLNASKPQKVASKEPYVIIPNFQPNFKSRKPFLKNNYIFVSNESINNASEISGKSFQGKIPPVGTKHLKVIDNGLIRKSQKTYTYKHFVSLAP